MITMTFFVHIKDHYLLNITKASNKFLLTYVGKNTIIKLSYSNSGRLDTVSRFYIYLYFYIVGNLRIVVHFYKKNEFINIRRQWTFTFYTALADSIGTKIQSVETLVRVEDLWRRKSSTIYQKPRCPGSWIRSAGSLGSAIRNCRRSDIRTCLFPIKGKSSLSIVLFLSNVTFNLDTPIIEQ